MDIENTHELALDALLYQIDEYGGLWSNDADELRDTLSPLVNAIMDLGSDHGPDVWDAARKVLLEAAHRRC